MAPKSLMAAAVLLLAVAAEASSARGLLAAPVCDVHTQMLCGGKCVPWATDRLNCGACGIKCGPTQACMGGGCVCPMNRPSECLAGICTNVATDNANCGYCGNICPSNNCADGICPGDDNCGQYQVKCNGICRNMMDDAQNCGKCGVVCKGGSICVGGGCVCPDAKPDVCAPGVCTNKLTDNNNCGWCTNKCPLGKVCKNGACVKAPVVPV